MATWVDKKKKKKVRYITWYILSLNQAYVAQLNYIKILSNVYLPIMLYYLNVTMQIMPTF